MEKGTARSPLLFVSVIDRGNPHPHCKKSTSLNMIEPFTYFTYYFLKLIFYFKCSKQGQVSHQVFLPHHFYLFSEQHCLLTKETEEFLYIMVAKQKSHQDEKDH